jgi:Icc protein
MPTANDTDNTRIYQLEQSGNSADQPIRVVQISDMHLFADPQSALLGLKTNASFQAVLDLVQQEQTHIDLLLTTGDVAQQPDPITYQRFLALTSSIKAPHFCTQGNHDLEQPFNDNLQKNKLPCEIVIGSWCFILLDSSEDGEIAGHLNTAAMTYLQQALQRHTDKHVIIALHHNPIAVGCAWLDQHMLQNSQPFITLIEQYSNVKAVIHGHVHQEFNYQLTGIDYLACPSTSLQFKPNSHSFQLDTQNPGYRWLSLYADGRLQTGVSRLQQSLGHIEYESAGY